MFRSPERMLLYVLLVLTLVAAQGRHRAQDVPPGSPTIPPDFRKKLPEKRTTITFNGWKTVDDGVVRSDKVSSNFATGQIGQYLFFLGGVSDAHNTTIPLHEALGDTTVYKTDITAFNVLTGEVLYPLMRSSGSSSAYREAALSSPVVGSSAAVVAGSQVITVGFCTEIAANSFSDETSDDAFANITEVLRTVQFINVVQPLPEFNGSLVVDVTTKRMPSDALPRYNATCIQEGNYVYIIGGIPLLNGTSLSNPATPFRTVSVYNFVTGEFVESAWSADTDGINITPYSQSGLLFFAENTVSPSGPSALPTISFLNRNKNVYVRELQLSLSAENQNVTNVDELTILAQNNKPQLFLYKEYLFWFSSVSNYNLERGFFDKIMYCSLSEERPHGEGPPSPPSLLRDGRHVGVLTTSFAPLRKSTVIRGVVESEVVEVSMHKPPPRKGAVDVDTTLRKITNSRLKFFMFGGKTHLGGTSHDIFEGTLLLTEEEDSFFNESSIKDTNTSVKKRNSPVEVVGLQYVSPLSPLSGANVTEAIDAMGQLHNAYTGAVPLWLNCSFQLVLSDSAAEQCTDKTGHRGTKCRFMFSTSPSCDTPLLVLEEVRYENTTQFDTVALGYFYLTGNMKTNTLEMSYLDNKEEAAQMHGSVHYESSLNTTQPQVFLYTCLSTTTIQLRPDEEEKEMRPIGSHPIPPRPGQTPLLENIVFHPINSQKNLFAVSSIEYFFYHHNRTAYEEYFVAPSTTDKVRSHWFLTLFVICAIAVVMLVILCRICLYKKYYYAKFFGGDRGVSARLASQKWYKRLSADSQKFSEEGSASMSVFSSREGEEGVGEVTRIVAKTVEKRQQDIILHDKYKVIRVLGRGSFSIVYLVERVDNGKLFALKYIFCSNDLDRKEAMKECELIYSLQNQPNVIKLTDMFLSYAFDVKNGTLSGTEITVAREGDNAKQGNEKEKNALASLSSERYLSLILEYHERGDLSSFVRSARKRLPADSLDLPHARLINESLIVSVAYQVLTVLKDMHARSPPILHRDLKPENILISSSRELVSRFSYDAKPFDEEKNLPVVVSDFGLSRVMEKSFCESGVGSLPYVAPECWRRQYSGKADIWSLGCILYAMCSFNVDRSNVKVMFSECNNPTFTEKIMEEVVSFGYSMSFAQFVVFLLTVDPAQRPSATEALDFLMTSPEESCKPLLRLLI